jgi:hypothetical protein
MRSLADVIWAIRSVIMTKQSGYFEELSELISRACIAVCPSKPTNFNVDHVRSVKVKLIHYIYFIMKDNTHFTGIRWWCDGQ